MNTWDYIVVEAYCFADTEEPPCGKAGTSGFCLLGCPYFGHCDATPREAALDIPLRLIVWDKLCGWADTLCWNLRWYFWDRWRYDNDWLNNIPCTQPSEDELPVLMRSDIEDRFKLWLQKTMVEEGCGYETKDNKRVNERVNERDNAPTHD